MNLTIVLACLLALSVLAGGSYMKGRRDGAAVTIADQRHDDEIRMETLQLAQQGAAEAIAATDIKQVTIRQKVETITREVPVYRDCINDPAVERLLNDARANTAPAAEPAGSGVLPEAGSSPSP